MKRSTRRILGVLGSLSIFAVIYWGVHLLLGKQIFGEVDYNSMALPIGVIIATIFLVSFGMAAFGLTRSPLALLLELAGLLGFAILFAGGFDNRQEVHWSSNRILVVMVGSVIVWDLLCYFASRRFANRKLPVPMKNRSP